MRRLHGTAALLAVVILQACGHGKPAAEPGPTPGDVGIEVENQSSASLTIYLVTGSVRHRLGQVNAQDGLAVVKSWAEWSRGGAVIYLRAEVIGSDEAVVSDNLRVQPGQVIQWVLTPNLRMSRVVLY
jgi:hypothetical protein